MSLSLLVCENVLVLSANKSVNGKVEKNGGKSRSVNAKTNSKSEICLSSHDPDFMLKDRPLHLLYSKGS